MRSLHDVHEINAKRSGHVCLSVRVIQIENRWSDLYGIWCAWYATTYVSKIVISNFLQSVISTWRTNKLVRWDPH
jgi:hypothetical protein